MKRLVFIIGIFSIHLGFGQTFTRQSQIDSFPIINPDLTFISEVTIEGDDITNLNGFKNIEDIFSLVIKAKRINDFSGLEKLKLLEHLYIKDCNFTSFLGLSKVQRVASFNIDNCPNFVDFVGIGDIDYCETIVLINNSSLQSLAGLKLLNLNIELSIKNNPNLVNINALNNIDMINLIDINISNNLTLGNVTINKVRELNSFTVKNNMSLASLDLHDEIVAKDMKVYDNPNLTSCDNLCILVQNSESYEVHDNGACNIYGSDCLGVSSQCLSGITSFTSQQEIDDFILDYPNCTEIIGEINIKGNDIHDFQGFKHINSIETLNIGTTNNVDFDGFSKLRFVNEFKLDSSNIINFNGLSNIDTIKNIYISNCPNLESFVGLGDIEYCEEFRISTCSSLTILNGLEISNGTKDFRVFSNQNLKEVNLSDDFITSFNCTFTIDLNPSLEKIILGNGIKELDWFAIHDNESLRFLHANEKLVSKTVIVRDNPLLSTCKTLCDITQLSTDLSMVFLNNPKCNFDNPSECESRLHVIAFFDSNKNGIYEQNEWPMRNVKFEININGENEIFFSNKDGRVNIPVYDELGNISIQMQVDTGFLATTDPYTLTYDSYDDIKDQEVINFGIIGNGQNHAFLSNISSKSPRCFEDVEFKLAVVNIGSYTENGKVIIRYDGYNTFTGVADPMPTSIDTVKHLLYYDYQDFQPFEQREYIFWLKMPGVEAIDQFISNSGIIYNVENGDTLIISHTNLREKIRCSYDPNDKTAYPFGEYDEHYTLKDDTLRYTIRFQNTGNAEAYNIKVRDTLSTNLDWNTFKVLNSSHTVETSITRNGAVVFAFDNIFLPDSTSNPAGSQGYVTYEILPKEHLPENTLIENTAFIYFDYNPAIVTNTTFNTMVTEIPVGTDDILSKNALAVYPNPTDEVFRIGLESSEELVVELLDLTGRVVKRYDYRKKKTYSMNRLESGLYFVKVSDKLNGRDLGVGKIVKN